LFHRVGFGEGCDEAALDVLGDRSVVGVAAGDDDAGVGIEFVQLLDRFSTPHAARDRQVHDNQVEGVLIGHCLRIGRERGCPVWYRGRLIAKTLGVLRRPLKK